MEIGEGKFLDEKEIRRGTTQTRGKWDMHLHIEKRWHEKPFPYLRSRIVTVATSLSRRDTNR